MIADLYNPGADWEVEKCSAFAGRFTNIAVCAWGIVDTGTGLVVHNTIDINFFEFVLDGLDVPLGSPSF